jgi:hypothetical protein
MDSVLSVKKFQHNNPFTLMDSKNILPRGVDDAFHAEDCLFLWIVQETPCFIPFYYVVKEFVVFIRQIDDVTGNAHSCFFLFGRQPSRYQIVTNTANVQHAMKNTVTTSYRNFQPVMQFGSQIFYCHFSQHCTRSTFASSVDVDGRQLRGSSSMISRPS